MTDLLKLLDNTISDCFQSYNGIAEKLMNDYLLQAGSSFYRIVECEFYFTSTAHEDPYVHGNKRQKESCGEWYFHGSGLDITISNGPAHGGILLRGITSVKSVDQVPARNETTNGPIKVCTEIFKQFGSAFNTESTAFGLVAVSKVSPDLDIKRARVFSVPRIGLNKGIDNEQNFCERPYRFVTFLHLPHGQADYIKKYLTGEADERLSIDEYKQYYNGKKC